MATGSTETSADPDTAHARIVQHQTACCYTEGQVSFVELTGPDGAVVAERAFVALTSVTAALDVDLAPGTYTLRSWQRACSAICPDDPAGESNLDQASDECSAALELGAGERVVRTISFAPGEGCTIEDEDTAVEVPDEVALRPMVRGCGTDFLSDHGDVEGRARRCLIDAHERGEPAEAWSYEQGDPERPDFYIRVTSASGVVVFKHDAQDESWTRTQCTGLESTGDQEVFRETGCGDPRVLA